MKDIILPFPHHILNSLYLPITGGGGSLSIKAYLNRHVRHVEAENTKSFENGHAFPRKGRLVAFYSRPSAREHSVGDGGPEL